MIKHILVLAMVVFTTGKIFSQNQLADKAIIVSSGKFETAPPFLDFVTVASYNLTSKTFQNFDQIGNQSAQTLLVDKDFAFIAAEDSLVKYDLKTQTRLAVGFYPGPSVHSLAIGGNKLLVGNWYGKKDSNLFIYDAMSLQLMAITAGIKSNVKSILVKGDTAYLAQNISGTIDACAPFGCFTDSIGQIALVQISTNTNIATFTLGTNAAGVSDLFWKGGNLVTVNSISNSITQFNTQNKAWQTDSILGVVGKGIAILGDSLLVEINGFPTYYNILNHGISAPLTSFKNAATSIYDSKSNTLIQSTTDYSTFGKAFVSKNNMRIDSFATGVSPENIAFHFMRNSTPVFAQNDTVSIFYTSDTLINVTRNDIDSSQTPLHIQLLSNSNIPGAIVVVDSSTWQIHYTAATGIIAQDSILYQVCNGSGACDTAVLYVFVNGVTNTGIESLNPSILVFPNPFSTEINFPKSSIVKVYNEIGAIVLADADVSKIKLDFLPAGNYILSLQTEKTVFRRLISKK